MTDTEISDKILKCRQFLLIHNYIFHIENARVCTDEVYDKMSDELKDLQTKYPDIASSVQYADIFKDWVNHNKRLPLCEDWVIRKALFVTSQCKKTLRETKPEKQVAESLPTKKGALF